MSEQESPQGGNSGASGVVTRRDIVDQNIDKVFPEGPSAPEPAAAVPATIAPRPGFIVSATELDAAKMLAMAGPLIPSFLQGNPGQCFAVIQLAKRWSRYDERTNSWISFDPVAIASQMYLVEGKGGTLTVGYQSQFIGALVDAFSSARLRFRYDGEAQERTCTCYGMLAGDPEPYEYTTPPLRTITPKRSPLWESDPDRQLAYYARRAWARLFTPGVLLGVQDVDELEGRVVHRVRDVSPIPAQGLHERLAAAAQANEGAREGFHVQVVDSMHGEAAEEPQEAEKPAARTRTARKLRKAAESRRTGKAGRSRGRPETEAAHPARKPAREAPAAAREEAPKAAPKPPPVPTNPKAYAQWVAAWLPTLDTEEAIEARWRSEMKLRNVCGVVEEQRAVIRMTVDMRVREIREAQS